MAQYYTISLIFFQYLVLIYFTYLLYLHNALWTE